MCGIFGYVGNNRIDLKAATDIIRHRGPDAEGFLQYHPESGQLIHHVDKSIQDGPKRVLLGFRRLSIIDLNEHSNQPFSDPTDQYHLIFNGEIYNYLELRQELEKKGHVFRTQSDTEVLLQAYLQWGVDCVKKFNGMWAFCLLDIPGQRLFCSRDRFGIKPFFYHPDHNGNLYFASEIKQILTQQIEKKLNEKLVRDFIDKGIVDHTLETFFEGIYQLPAASFMCFDLRAPVECKPRKYWELESNADYEKLDYHTAKAQFKNLFTDSVKLRFRSDVPVGSCLSGGLDSSSIVAVASQVFDFPIHTFTSQFDLQQFDETTYVRMLKDQYRNLNTHFCQLNEEIFKKEIHRVIFHQDEPFGAMSILAQWEVMKLAKNNKVTVLLDGQGGDEQLAGYRKFYAFFLKEKLGNLQLKQFFKEGFFLLKNKDFDFFSAEGIKRYLGIKASFDYYNARGENLPLQARIGLTAASTMNERAKLDINQFSFPPLLRYEDRNSMAFSIESRVPFMDYRLVEFLYSIPSDYKIRNGYTKAILRDSLNGTLPDAIGRRISKLGFATPQEVWMGTTLFPYFYNYFKAMDNPYLDNQKNATAFQKLAKTKREYSDLFFRFFCFDKWFQIHFGEKKINL